MSRLLGRLGNLGGDYELSIGFFFSSFLSEMACLTLGGRKSLGIAREPMGIWPGADYSKVSDMSFRVV